MRKLMLCVALIISLSAAPAVAAARPQDEKTTSSEVQDAADGGDVSVRTQGRGLGEGAGGGGDEGGGDGSGGPSVVPVEICVSTTVDAAIARQLTGRTDIADGSMWVVTSCDVGPGSIGANEIRDVVAVGEPPSPYVLLEEAKRRLVVPLPEPRLSPTADVDHLVGIPEWLAVDPGGFAPVDATAAVPGLAVTLAATPSHTVWDLGNGDTVTCQGAGVPWSPGTPVDAAPPCGYVYQSSSTGSQPDGVYHVNVTTVWARVWTCTPACAGGVLPDLGRTTGFDLTVRQGQAIITRVPA
jgi:hypothetical protein